VIGRSALAAVALLGLAAAGCGAAGAAVSPSPQSSPESPGLATPTPVSGSPQPASTLEGAIGPPGGPGAATQLMAKARCEEAGSRTGVADLSWLPAANSGSEERVALTIFPEGFDTGNFQVSPPLAAGAASYTWPKTNPGGVHRWRVLTKHGSTWTPSEISMFSGATCVADMA
jgi:hypothetical protein